jgi:dienelactone hydrolase
MLKALQVSILILISTIIIAAQSAAPTPSAVRIDPSPKDGFSYPYYLYVPNEIRDPSVQKQTHTFLVLPNNTGKVADALGVHEADVKRRAAQAPIFASMLKVAVIMPVFPRPETDWRIYTHALDRDSMVTSKKEYARFDLQLVAMIDDARRRLKKENLTMDRRVLLNGYSAQGMFANRFAFLHPGRVKAAAIGSPGGWPIAPVSSYKDKTLRYPIGVADIRTVSGKALDLGQLKKVPLLIFLGDKDENDSVVFGDSYDDQDKQLILPLFGAKPVDRWEISKTLYREAGLNAEFRLYPGIGHTVTPQMRSDVVAFLQKYR